MEQQKKPMIMDELKGERVEKSYCFSFLFVFFLCWSVRGKCKCTCIKSSKSFRNWENERRSAMTSRRVLADVHHGDFYMYSRLLLLLVTQYLLSVKRI
jgi:hypothetical protein